MADLSKLTVMMKPTGRDGEVTPLLCDADGNALPGQISVKLETSTDGMPVATVQFGMIEFR